MQFIRKFTQICITIEAFGHRKFLTLAAKSVSVSVLNTTFKHEKSKDTKYTNKLTYHKSAN